MPIITVDYGYDVHSMEIDDDTWSKIKAGETVAVDGQGFVHDEEGQLTDHWVISSTSANFHLDNGAEFFGLAMMVTE